MSVKILGHCIERKESHGSLFTPPWRTFSSKMDVIIILWESFSRYDTTTLIKLLVLWGKTPLEIHQDLLAALEGHSPTIHTVWLWVREILLGRVSVEEGSRPGRPVIACGDAHLSLLSRPTFAENTGKTCRQIADEVSVSSAEFTEFWGTHWTKQRLQRGLQDGCPTCSSKMTAPLCTQPTWWQNFCARTTGKTWITLDILLI